MDSPLRHLLPYHRRYFAPFWGGMFVLLFARVFEALVPLYLRDGIDLMIAMSEGADEFTRGDLAWPAVFILLCVAGRFCCVVWSRQVIRRIGVAIAYDLRKRVYAHLQLQGQRFFSRHPTGDLMARAINDINLIRQLIGMGFRTILVLVFSGVVGFACMFALAPGLTLMLLAPMPVIFVLGIFLARDVFRRSMRVQEGFSGLSERVQENLGGIRTVQALVQERHESERFGGVNQDYADRYLALIRANSVIAAVMPWLSAICTATIIGYGGWLVTQGSLTVGTLAAFLWYLNMVLWPMRQAGQMVMLWQQGASGTERLFEVLNNEPEIPDHGARTAPPSNSALEVRDLTVAYSPGAPEVLREVSVTVPAGTSLAVLGRTGAGKTSLLRAMVRMIDPPEGSVQVGGVSVQAFSLETLRSYVVLVPQEPFLFADLLRNNLSYAEPEKSEVEIRAAAGAAALEETIGRLPDALDTLVGERGVTLSGGQKQRATLARGLIRDAGVLLLDDCFSSVDTETEEEILDALLKLRSGRTTVLVSHRISTARHADRVLILEEGAVVEYGSPDELLQREGYYQRLERSQRAHHV